LLAGESAVRVPADVNHGLQTIPQIALLRAIVLAFEAIEGVGDRGAAFRPDSDIITITVTITM
jgi:hypothetical protein